jgi:hypothetical protein
MKKKLPCGGFGYIRVELRLTGCPDIDLTKITEKRQELFSAVQAQGERQQDLDFDDENLPCERCATFDCQNCQYVDGVNMA